MGKHGACKLAAHSAMPGVSWEMIGAVLFVKNTKHTDYCHLSLLTIIDYFLLFIAAHISWLIALQI